MSFDFVKQVISIGGATTEPALRFYRKGFGIGGSLSWQDIVLDGKCSLAIL